MIQVKHEIFWAGKHLCPNAFGFDSDANPNAFGRQMHSGFAVFGPQMHSGAPNAFGTAPNAFGAGPNAFGFRPKPECIWVRPNAFGFEMHLEGNISTSTSFYRQKLRCENPSEFSSINCRVKVVLLLLFLTHVTFAFFSGTKELIMVLPDWHYFRGTYLGLFYSIHKRSLT
jgi:hypothetical protein